MNSPAINSLWLAVSKAVDAYAEAASTHNEELAELANYFSQQKTRQTNTEHVKAPFRYSAETNGSVSIDGKSLSMFVVPDEIDRCFGLTIGKFNPNHPMFLRFGGDAAAREAGIRKEGK